MSDDYQRRTYGDTPVGFGHKPGIVVVDFMVAFTDPKYPLGGAPLVLRAFENTIKMLEVARRYNVPVASCNTAYMNERDAVLEDQRGTRHVPARSSECADRSARARPFV